MANLRAIYRISEGTLGAHIAGPDIEEDASHSDVSSGERGAQILSSTEMSDGILSTREIEDEDPESGLLEDTHIKDDVALVVVQTQRTK